MSEIDFSMNESLNRFLGITEKDINKTNNMIKIVKSYSKDKTRPLRYTRGYEIK